MVLSTHISTIFFNQKGSGAVVWINTCKHSWHYRKIAFVTCRANCHSCAWQIFFYITVLLDFVKIHRMEYIHKENNLLWRFNFCRYSDKTRGAIFDQQIKLTLILHMLEKPYHFMIFNQSPSHLYKFLVHRSYSLLFANR